MEVDKELIKEIKKDVILNKIFNFIKMHKKLILILISLLIFGLLSNFFYGMYLDNIAQRDGVIFVQAKEDISKSNNEEALKLLDGLIKDGTKGYEFLSYMEKAKLSLSNNDVKGAVDILSDAHKNISLSQYYKDIIQTIIFIIRLNNMDDLDNLALDIKKTLNKSNQFYYHNLELYGSILVYQQKYKDAIPYFVEIIDSQGASKSLKDRAKRLKSLSIGYIN